MDSRERVLMSLNHQQPDRVPIDFRATDRVVKKLLKNLGKCGYYELLDHFNVDFREVIPGYIGPALRKMNDGSQLDIWGVGWKESVTETSRDKFVSYSPLSKADSVDDILSYNWPDPDIFDFSGMLKQCEIYSGYAISTPGIHCEGFHGVFHLMTYLFGMEKVMIDLILNTHLVEAAVKQVMKFIIGFYERMFEAARGRIDFLFYKDDFGTQNSLLISRNMFLRFFSPVLQDLVKLADSYGATFILHSCGSIIDLIPDFIDLGIKVLDPIQVSAKDMNIWVLKDRFGDKLTFHGGIDTQTVLPQSSPEQIRGIVTDTIDILGKSGGYFFCPSHRIQTDTPLENIFAMYETASSHNFKRS